jgi:hypothetical protein
MRPSIQYNVTSQWNGGYVMEVFITNEGTLAIQDYRIGFDLPGTITDVWDGVIGAHSGLGYVIQDDDDKNDIAPGETVRFKFKVLTDSGEMPSSFTVNDEPAAVNGVEPAAAIKTTEVTDTSATQGASEPVESSVTASVTESATTDDGVIHVGPGITAAELEALIAKAPAGATLQLPPGTIASTSRSISRVRISP